MDRARRKAVRDWAVDATTKAGGGAAHRWTQVQVAWAPVTTRASVAEGRAACDQEVVEEELGKWEKIWETHRGPAVLPEVPEPRRLVPLVANEAWAARFGRRRKTRGNLNQGIVNPGLALSKKSSFKHGQCKLPV